MRMPACEKAQSSLGPAAIDHGLAARLVLGGSALGAAGRLARRFHQAK